MIKKTITLVAGCFNSALKHRQRLSSGKRILGTLAAGLALWEGLHSARAAAAYWLNPVDGDWTDGFNWNTDPFAPDNGNGGTTYDVTIDAAGADYSVSIGSDITVDSLTLNSTNAIVQGFGLLEVLGTANLTQGTYNLKGGTLKGGIWNVSAGAFLNMDSPTGNLLDGVTINGSLRMTGSSSLAVISGGTTFTTAHLAGNSSGLRFAPGQTLSGTIFFAGENTSGSRTVEMNGTDGIFTVGPTGVIRTGDSRSGTHAQIGHEGGMSLVNQGLISAEAAGYTLWVNPDTLTGNGTFQAINRGSLRIDTGTFGSSGTFKALGGGSLFILPSGTWSNTGSITLDASSWIVLGGTFDATGGIGVFHNPDGGHVTISDTLLNTGNTLTLNSGTGSWTLGSATLKGGTVDFADGKSLFFAGVDNILDGVKVNGDLHLSHDSSGVRIIGTTSFNNAYVTGTDSSLGFAPGYTLNGTIFFQGPGFVQGPTYEIRTVETDGTDGTFTVGPTGAIRTGPKGARNVDIIGLGWKYGGSMSLVNQGLISSETFERALDVMPASLTGNGTLQAINGGTLNITPLSSWTNAGTITLDALSTVNLGGTFDTTGGIGVFHNPDGGEVNITGTLLNTGNTLTLNSGTGSWTLTGGTIQGGVVNLADGKSLLFAGLSENLLDGVTVNGDLRLNAHTATTRISGGASFTTAHLAGGSSVLGFATGQTVNGTILFEGAGSGYRIVEMDGHGGTLTVGATGAIRTAPDLGNNTQNLIGRPFRYGGAMTLINDGLISAETAGRTVSIQSASLTNSGTLQALNGGTLNIGPGTTVTNYRLSSETLTDGIWKVVSNGAATTLSLNQGGNITTNSASVLLSGADAVFTEINALNNNKGSFAIANNRDFTTAGSLTNSGGIRISDAGTDLIVSGAINNTATGQVLLEGGRLEALGITNSGSLSGFGAVTGRPVNHGTIRASGGALVMNQGIQGGSGTVRIDPGGSLDLSAGVNNSNGDYLIHNGDTPGSLNLGANHFEVAVDYTNAGTGTGNAYNPRANITGAGQINAAGDITQILAGNVIDGNTSNARLDFGNMHVGGSATLGYQIGNGGTAGPALRGAIQTAVGGGGITDSRLSGTGVTDGNFGPVAAGALGGGLAVTFAPDTAGPLSGQTVGIVNNFDNVADQSLSITGTAYRLASPGLPGGASADFGIVHVGDTVTRTLTIINTAADDGFSESLNASFSGSTGGISTSGSLVLLASGGSGGTLTVGFNTSAAGSVSGTATVEFVSDGQGTSGLGQSTLPGQVVTVSGQVNHYAAPLFIRQSGDGHFVQNSPGDYTLDFGIIGPDEAPVMTLGLRNEVSGLSDTLAGTFLSDLSGFTASGFDSFSGIEAGQTLEGLTISMDNSRQGSFSGSITLSAASRNSGGYDGGLGSFVIHLQGVVVPEPSGPVLLLLAGAGLFGRRTRRRAPSGLSAA